MHAYTRPAVLLLFVSLPVDRHLHPVRRSRHCIPVLSSPRRRARMRAVSRRPPLEYPTDPSQHLHFVLKLACGSRVPRYTHFRRPPLRAPI